MSIVNVKQFVSVIRNQRKPLPSYVSNVIQYIKNSHEAISKFDLDLDCKETPKEVIELTKITKDYGDFVVAFAKNINKFSPVYCSTPDETIISDLDYIKNDTAKSQFFLDEYNEGMIIFVKEIITHDIHRDITHNFGSFKFHMSKKHINMQKFSNNSERNGRYHPYHTPDDRLCLGSYKIPYEIAMDSCNFFAAYTLVMRCLTVYGGDDLKGRVEGPQNPIELWIGQVCSVCDSPVPLEEIAVCGKTHRAICPACIDSASCTDEINNEIYHPDVLKTCSKCNKLTSTVIRKVCFGCREKAVIGV